MSYQDDLAVNFGLFEKTLRDRRQEYIVRSIICRWDAWYWEALGDICYQHLTTIDTADSSTLKLMDTQATYFYDQRSKLIVQDVRDRLDGRLIPPCIAERIETAIVIPREAIAADGDRDDLSEQSVLELLDRKRPRSPPFGGQSPRTESEKKDIEVLAPPEARLEKDTVLRRDIVLRRERHSPSEEENITPPPVYIHCDGNQFTLGGPSACTSISFVSAAAMRERKDADTIITEINWDKIMHVGIQLWNLWLKTKSPSERGNSRFQTLEQIREMPEMAPTFELLGGSPLEFGGRIDGFDPNQSIKTQKELDEYSKNYPGLQLALQRVSELGRGAVAVITIGSVSISLWSSGPTLLKEGSTSPQQFVLFDSHGPTPSSTVAICERLPPTCLTIVKMCNVQTWSGRKSQVWVGTEDVAYTYCMYAFRPK